MLFYRKASEITKNVNSHFKICMIICFKGVGTQRCSKRLKNLKEYRRMATRKQKCKHVVML